MKKRLTIVLALVLSLVLGLSLVACNGNGNGSGNGGGGGGGSTPGITQAEWEAAFDKADTFPNRTVESKLKMAMSLAYNGAPVTEETDFGNGLTGEMLLPMIAPMLISTEMGSTALIDSENGKANVLEKSIQRTSEYNYNYFYRANGSKLEETEVYSRQPIGDIESNESNTSKNVYKYIYGPYKDAATVKGILVGMSSFDENLEMMDFTDKDGQPFDIKKDLNKFTYANNAYSAEVKAEADGLVMNGTGTIVLTDGYVSSIKMTVNQAFSFDEIMGGGSESDAPSAQSEEGGEGEEGGVPDLPEGLELVVNAGAEIVVKNVGTTTVTDTGLETAEEKNTWEYPVITTAEEFAGLFAALEGDDGIRIRYDEDDYSEVEVQIKKTATGYNAYVEERTLDEHYDLTSRKEFFYVVSASGIQKYEGKYAAGGYELIGWKEPTTVSQTGTLAALAPLLPKAAGYLLATYNDGKTLSELFSKFAYVGPEELSAKLTTGTETIKVLVEFSYDEDDEAFELSTLEFGPYYIYSISGAYDIDDLNPSTFGQQD